MSTSERFTYCEPRGPTHGRPNVGLGLPQGRLKVHPSDLLDVLALVDELHLCRPHAILEPPDCLHKAVQQQPQLRKGLKDGGDGGKGAGIRLGGSDTLVRASYLILLGNLLTYFCKS